VTSSTDAAIAKINGVLEVRQSPGDERIAAVNARDALSRSQMCRPSIAV
jgi:hypothetical protein